MDVKRTTKIDAVIKNGRIEDGLIIDENGAEIDIVSVATKLYGTGEFKLTLTASSSEELVLDEE